MKYKNVGKIIKNRIIDVKTHRMYIKKPSTAQ